MPDLYYTIIYELADGTTIRLMMIDTQVHCDRIGSDRPYPYFAPQSAADDQLTWLTNELDKSDSFDWNFVVGHYQLQDPAGGNDIKFEGCMDNIDSLLQNYPVTAYINGHEHYISHLESVAKPGFHYITSGWAHIAQKVPDGPNDAVINHFSYSRSLAAAGGFAAFRINRNEVNMDFWVSSYDSDEAMYSADLAKKANMLV